jgi:hypothetical protein
VVYFHRWILAFWRNLLPQFAGQKSDFFSDMEFEVHTCTHFQVLENCGCHMNQLKKVKLTGAGKKFHDGKFHYVYTSPNIFREIRSRRMRWMAGSRAMYQTICKTWT